MLIRHNVRTGKNQSVHFAHDTEQPDRNGCFVSGRTGRVFTSEGNPCPQCRGWGRLVPIAKLSRDEYPAGAVVPERYRQTRTEVPTETPSVPTPEVETPKVEAPSVPVSTDDAAQAMQAMLAAIVPEAGKIRETITQAVQQARTEAKADGLAEVDAAVKRLSESFDETVRRLIVPTTVEVRTDRGETREVAGSVHNVFTECLEWMQARDQHDGRPRNLYLTGPAGCGKTTLAKQLAQALGVNYYTTGQVLAEHQVMGFVDAGGTYHETPFYVAFTGGGVWLGDEFDGWSPEATLALNAALANGYATFPNSPEPVKASEHFYALVAANTWGHGADREYVGRNEMDASSLSRFVTIPVDYDKALETEIAGGFTQWRDLVWKVRDNATAHRMRVMVGTRELVHGVAALQSGIAYDKVVTRVLRRDMSESDWAKVSS